MDKQYFTLITGAGQGLGKSLAIECGKRGMNLLLIDQKAKELRQLAVFIRTSFRVLVFEFEKDLSKEESCFELQQEIENLGLNVNILINNAGVGGTFSFLEASHDTLLKEIKVNVTSLKPQNSMLEMKGKTFRINEGINTLPEYAAIYLMCRGAAEYA